MIKKYLVLLIMMVICYNSYGRLNNDKLRRQNVTSEINFQNLSIGDAFSVIAKDTGVNFIPDSDVKDIPMDISFPAGENMETLVNTILEIYHLNVSSIGEIFVVSKSIKSPGDYCIYGSVNDSIYKSGIDNVKITLSNSNYPAIYSGYGGKFIFPDVNPGVYIIKFEKKGYITKGDIINTKDKITSLKVALEKDNRIGRSEKTKITDSHNAITEDRGIITKKIILNNGNTKEIKDVVEENFGDSITISSIENQSVLILSGERKIVDNALMLIGEIDNNIQQIRISSQILDVSNNLFENLGVQWDYNRNNSNIQNGDKGVHSKILSSGKIAGINTIYGSSLNIKKHFHSATDVLDFQINMLEATQDLIVSARPSILVTNGQEGEFKITEEVIVGEKKDENTNNDRITSTPIFKEAGIILKVTPHIKENGFIVLDVLIEVSNFKLKYKKDDTADVGTFNSEGGSKIGRSIKTTIKMKDGQTVLIGGLKRATIHNANSKIPFFGTLPLFGHLFKNENIEHEMSDIYIRLKLDIVENEDTPFENNEIHEKINDIKDKRIF